MKKLLIALFLATNCITQCFGYFYHVEQLTNGRHDIFLLSDLHDLSSCYPGDREYKRKMSACNQQRIDLLGIAKRTDGYITDGYIIVEDMLASDTCNSYERSSLCTCSKALKSVYDSDPLSFDPMINCSQCLPDLAILSSDPQNQGLSPLKFLSQFCHQNKIPFINVECRLQSDEHPLKLFLASYNKNFAELKSYDDGKQFNAVYEELLGAFEQRQGLLEKLFIDVSSKSDPCVTMLQANKSLLDKVFSLASYSITNMPNLNFHDAVFIDIRILHSIHRSQHENVFVCAGAEHIKNVKQILISKLGYESKLQSGPNVTPSIFCDPDAVDLKIFFAR